MKVLKNCGSLFRFSCYSEQPIQYGYMYNRSNHIIIIQYVMAGKCGMEKMVYYIIKPYKIADPMTYRILD